MSTVDSKHASNYKVILDKSQKSQTKVMFLFQNWFKCFGKPQYKQISYENLQGVSGKQHIVQQNQRGEIKMTKEHYQYLCQKANMTVRNSRTSLARKSQLAGLTRSGQMDNLATSNTSLRDKAQSQMTEYYDCDEEERQRQLSTGIELQGTKKQSVPIVESQVNREEEIDDEQEDSWLTKELKQEFFKFFEQECETCFQKCTQDPLKDGFSLQIDEKKQDHCLKIWIKSYKNMGKFTTPVFMSEMFIPIDSFQQYIDFYNDCEKQRAIDATIDKQIQVNAFSDNNKDNNYVVVYNCLKKVLIVEPRDFLFVRHWKQRDENTWVEAQQQITHPDYPIFTTATRSDIIRTGTVATKVTHNGQPYMKIQTYVEADPKVTIPWFAMKSGALNTYTQNRKNFYNELKKLHPR